MIATSSDITDKNIVDRRKAHRNRDVARTIRSTREKLSFKAGGNINFERTLLKMHARSVIASAHAFPALIGLIATAGFWAGFGYPALIWAALSMLLYGFLIVYARRIDARDERKINVRSVTRAFLTAHFVAGLGWAGMELLECGACTAGDVAVIRGVLLLLAIAATAVVASALNGALIAAFTMPVAAYAFLTARTLDTTGLSMAAMLVASLPFFAYISRHLHTSTVMMLAFRSEKDALIAELETAKSMSDEARRRAEEANMAKSRFLASMSHELRTPLNAILGFSEVMANEILGPIRNDSYREYARDIHESGRHLLDLINEILDLSRIEAGRYQINEEPVGLSEVLDDCCHMLEIKTRSKEIAITRKFEADLPPVLADERSIRQVALNLLSNAVKFTPSGGEIVIKAGWTSGGGQYISIRDNGPGIAEEEIPIVLSAFGQGSIAIKSAEQGTGLGLPIVQAIMQMHGGRFELKSKLREGTEVIATFPASRVLKDGKSTSPDTNLHDAAA